ncbi:hypothetical protein [Lysobacter olei]
MNEHDLPALPEALLMTAQGRDGWTADQMRDYARAAITALQPGEAVAWRRDTPYGIGYSFASEDVMRDMADWLAPTTPPSLPAGWALVPERMHAPADAWESAAFSFGGPAAGDGEAYLDCTLWVGNIENDDGTKTYGLHVSCDECPEEGMTTLAEFAAAPQPQREASEAGQGVDWKCNNCQTCFADTPDAWSRWRDAKYLSPSCPYCKAANQFTYPHSTAALMGVLEHYGFTCEAGPLVNCVDWKKLRERIATHTQEGR